MVSDLLTSPQFLLGLAIALGAVVFWSGGFVVANYLWNRWRGERETGPERGSEDADE